MAVRDVDAVADFFLLLLHEMFKDSGGQTLLQHRSGFCTNVGMAENAVAANNWLGTAIQEGNGYSQNPVARIKEKSGLWILSRLGRTLVWEALTCMVIKTVAALFWTSLYTQLTEWPLLITRFPKKTCREVSLSCIPD